MTVSELYKQVAGLGFESSLEDDSRFYFAANRALLQVARIRPATSACHIHHAPLKNALGDTFSPVPGNEHISYTASDAKAFYFEADGNGTAYVETMIDGDWHPLIVIPLQSDRVFKAYRGLIKSENSFVNGAVRVRFFGNYLFHVRRAALYKDVYSADEKDIPAFEPFAKYDISVLKNDFLSLASPPIVDGEKRVENYEIENGRILLLPYGMPGEYTVRYIKRPMEIQETAAAVDDQQNIDLDDDLSALMPNLVAAYIWAEDEPQLAEYYLTLYQQQAAAIEAKSRSYTPIHIYNNGW